jgi:hypothetical protein
MCPDDIVTSIWTTDQLKHIKPYENPEFDEMDIYI